MNQKTLDIPPNALGIERIYVTRRLVKDGGHYVYVEGNGLEWGCLLPDDPTEAGIAEMIRLCLVGFKRGRKRA